MSADPSGDEGGLSPLLQPLSESSPEAVFNRVDEVLKQGSNANSDVMKELLGLLNEIRLGPSTSPADREKAVYFMSELEARFALYSNEVYAEPVRMLDFKKANKDAVDKIDIHGLLREEDVVIDKKHILGSGSFGTVYVGTKGGLPVAIKELNPDTTEDDAISFRNEAAILARIRHPYCCEYEGYLLNPFRIVTRRYPTDLYHYIMAGTLTTADRFRIAYQLVSAVHYLHSIGLLHRDLKTENVFIDENENVRVADFGLTQYAPDTVMDEENHPGTLLFMAPEQLDDKPFDQKSEVFTIGMMLWELFSGRQAFDDVGTIEELKERQKQVPMLPVTSEFYSTKTGDGKPPKEIFDLASKCYAYEPENRPDLAIVMRRILDIGVKYFVTRSETAEMFWKVVCSYTFRNHILLTELIQNMNVEKRFPIAVTLTSAVSPQWKLMDINHFWYLCCWFPNFFRSNSAYSLMEDIVRSSWYSVDEAQADKRLLISGRNGFVIRPSTSDPFRSPFTLCAKVEGDISYYHVVRHNKRSGVTFTCEFTGETPFTSLRHMAKFVEEKLHIPVAKKLSSLAGVYGNKH